MEHLIQVEIMLPVPGLPGLAWLCLFFCCVCLVCLVCPVCLVWPGLPGLCLLCLLAWFAWSAWSGLVCLLCLAWPGVPGLLGLRFFLSLRGFAHLKLDFPSLPGLAWSACSAWLGLVCLVCPFFFLKGFAHLRCGWSSTNIPVEKKNYGFWVCVLLTSSGHDMVFLEVLCWSCIRGFYQKWIRFCVPVSQMWKNVFSIVKNRVFR